MGRHGDERGQRRQRSRPLGVLVIVVVMMVTVVAVPARPAAAAWCQRGYIALTFDDGPSSAHSGRLLNILGRKRAKATFFMTGRAVAARPGRARWTKRAGHRIYNHTYDHVDLTTSSNAAIRRQVWRTERALRAAGATTSGRLVRPPYGATNTRVRNVLADMGFRQVLWTVDTRDWSASTSARQIERTVLNNLRPGANVLMHDQEDTQATVRALPRIIRKVRQRGYCLGIVNRYGNVRRA